MLSYNFNDIYSNKLKSPHHSSQRQVKYSKLSKNMLQKNCFWIEKKNISKNYARRAEINQGEAEITLLFPEQGKLIFRDMKKQDKHIFLNFIFVFHHWSYPEACFIDCKSLCYLYFFHNVPLLVIFFFFSGKTPRKKKIFFPGLTDFISQIFNRYLLPQLLWNALWLELSENVGWLFFNK